MDQEYSEQPGNLTFYPCPPGYCRCFQNLCSVGNETCSYAYFNDYSNMQCNCDREGEHYPQIKYSYSVMLFAGYLCGDCKDSKGVTVLLNHCVDCNNINLMLLAALCE